MRKSGQCQACRLEGQQQRNAEARARDMRESAPIEHWHFFRLESPNGATQEAVCVSNRAFGIKGCGEKKMQHNSIDQSAFRDWSMQSAEQPALLR
jgi:hypothetical protein